MRNDAAVVEALKGLEKVHFPNARRVVVQDVDYNILTFEEQIRTDLATDVMIGPHGAGKFVFSLFVCISMAMLCLFTLCRPVYF